MITTRLTFVLEQDGFSGWQLRELQRLCGYFHSIFVAYNISRGKSASVIQPLQMMSMGSCRHDLCQIAIEGRDAELACLVLTEYLRDHSTLFSSSHKQNHYADELFSCHPAFQLPFQYDWYGLPQSTFNDKNTCLQAISRAVTPSDNTTLFNQLIHRESIASTIIAPGIAMPHVKSAYVDTVTFCMALIEEPLDWHPSYDGVTLIIGVILPLTASKEQIRHVTRLTKWLISSSSNPLLSQSKRQETVKGILLHIMHQDT